MKRKMMFRAWFSGYGEVVNPSMEYNFNLTSKQGKILLDGYDLDVIFGQEVTLMESTGLLDKNGEMIWEGDIIEDQSYPDVRYRICSVEYLAPAFSLRMGDNTLRHIDPRNLVDMEVIGNIYEHPNLLTKNHGPQGDDLKEQDRSRAEEAEGVI